MTKLAQLADSARVDLVGLVLALVTLAFVKFGGVDVDRADVLIGTIGAAFGRGVLITAKRKAQQAALIDLVEAGGGFISPLKSEPETLVLTASPEPAAEDEVTAPIDVVPHSVSGELGTQERHG